MTEDRRQEDFAQRLSRISRERGDEVDPTTGGTGHDKSDFDYNAPIESHPVRNSIIWVVILAALGTGGYFGWGMLPQDLRDLISGNESAEASAPASPEDIAETGAMSNQGPVYASPLIAHAGDTPLNLDNVLTQVSLPTGDTSIANVIPIARNGDCTLRTPAADEKVMGVRIENALLPAPLHSFSDRQLTGRVLENIEAVTQGKVETVAQMDTQGQKTSLDVVLTDTSAPLYLVLQNMGPGIVWNLHAAPDVQIAHVAIIGSDFSGVANIQQDTTIEALLVSDFIGPHQYGADDTPRACMIRPWRAAEADWIGSLKSAAGSLVYQNQMYSYTKGYEAYNNWYTDALGVSAATNTVTARDAAHVLLGAAPETPVTYAQLAGRDIHMMEADHLFLGDANSRSAAVQALHEDLLTAAVGGDLGALNPPVLERNSQ